MKYIYTFFLFSLFTNPVLSQQNGSISGRFGGPFATLSYNNQGAALSFGGGGTFYIKKGYYIGIFGQGMTDLVSKPVNIKGYETWSRKAKFTGFWVGYFDSIDKLPRFHISYYCKFGFGSVFLENSQSTIQHIDKSMLIAPHIEPIIRITSFFQIGLGLFYEIHSGVNLVSYKNKDYNALGMNISFRFTSAH